jgi:tRNA(adenine34) deaminase
VVRILQGAPFQTIGLTANNITPELIESLMNSAIELATRAAKLGEVPVGAVLWHSNKIIASQHNLVETNRDASAHAEMLVMREASSVLGDWRLSESILCVTLEPCTMCSGAIRLSRVGTVIFGAADPRLGATGSLYDICEDPRLGAVPRIIRGFKEKECGQILSDFFTKVRSV